MTQVFHRSPCGACGHGSEPVNWFITAEVVAVVIVAGSLLLHAVLSWWGSRPPCGRRVRDIARHFEDEDGVES
jgi:hypothetical protein